MSSTSSSTPVPPSPVPTGRGEQIRPRFSSIGPGLVVAATGVGAADLVATLVAGQNYGYALLWAIVLGCIMKIVLVEGAARYSLATGETIYEGWAKLGLWTSVYFGPYIVIWGIVYGAAAMAGTGIPLHAMFPQLGVTAWGIISGLVGLALVWFGRYGLVEKLCTALVAMMFVTMVGAAILTLPHLGDILAGLVPTIPEGSLVNMLSVAGGVGGTITLAAYGYWIREKGWTEPRHMTLMRFDNTIAYAVTGIFVVATLIVGAELLYSYGLAVNEKNNDQALIDLSGILAERYGFWAGQMFLVGFWAASMSSLIGVWNGVSMMFADFVGNSRRRIKARLDAKATDTERAEAGGLGRRLFSRPVHAENYASGGKWYKAYILWLTFPPMILLFFGRPVGLILAYGVMGSLFMPFLGLTLVFLLNSGHTPKEWRNSLWSNLVLFLVAVFFFVLAGNELWTRLT